VIVNLASERDPAVVPNEWWVERMRLRRNVMLQDSDFTQLADVPVDRAAWAAYRQQLRNAPAAFTPGPIWNAPNPPA